MVLVVIVYVGFLTTFSLVGREKYAFPHMAMIVTKIFFGSSYVGFDIMEDIDPIFGTSPFSETVRGAFLTTRRASSYAYLRDFKFDIADGFPDGYAKQ